jgi:hypothetical protein
MKKLYSGGDAFIAMVESADLGGSSRSDLPRQLNRPTDRGVLVQRQVSPSPFVVIEVGLQNTAEAGASAIDSIRTEFLLGITTHQARRLTGVW